MPGIVGGIEINGSEQFKNRELFMPGDVLLQCNRHSFPLGCVFSNPPRFINQCVVYG